MDQHSIIWIIVEGTPKQYPRYNRDNKVYLQTENPANNGILKYFYTSPVYSTFPNASEKILNQRISRIGFYLSANPLETIKKIHDQFQDHKENVWFSIGLANVIVISESDDFIKIHNFISEQLDIKNHEAWVIKDGVVNRDSEKLKIHDSTPDLINYKISSKLLAHEAFSVSEFLLSANKILLASSKFTPYYYEEFKLIFKSAFLRVLELEYLRGEIVPAPTELIQNIIVNNPHLKEKYINDRHGRIVQMNSSLSYIYNQIFSGSLPVLHHASIIRQHSLLGVGTGVNALYETLRQLEELFVEMQIDEKLSNEIYGDNIPKDLKLKCPSDHLNKGSSNLWSIIGKENLNKIQPSKYKKYEGFEPYFNRFSFFSGRLGFREYDYTATAAIQVLVESKSLKWNIINYTHEIIHNHVRLILNELIDISNVENENYIERVNEILPNLNNFISGNIKDEDITMTDFLSYSLFVFCIYTQYYGSLSIKHDSTKYSLSEKDIYEVVPLVPSDPAVMATLVKNSYKDISEIFVHTLDYAYIYKKRHVEYLRSIWSSWSTVPIVVSNLSHYVLRSLIIIGLEETGNSETRYKKASSELIKVCSELKNENFIFQSILDFMKNYLTNDDLRYRFHNCIVVGDIAYKFFAANVQKYLDRGDDLVSNDRPYYGLENGTFENIVTKSKVRFLLEQLFHTIDNKDEIHYEWNSAWLLLATSINYNG